MLATADNRRNDHEAMGGHPNSFCHAILAFPILCFGLPGCSDAPEQVESLRPSVGAGAETPTKPSTVRNTISWQTATEEEVFGFILERADREDGEFSAVNPRPIAAGGTIDETRSYTIVDEEVIAGTTYYYRIMAVGYNNRLKPFSPVFPYQTPR